MERFEYVESLAEGAYGVVWLCIDHETNQKVAMKRFKEAHTDPEVLRLALREVRMLKAAQHPHVVKLQEAFRSKSGRVYIAMEYIEHTLTNDLRKYHGKGMPPLLAKVLAWQMLQAVSHLHKIKMMHRDLKPANILVTPARELKLCDFGFARSLHPRVVAEYTTYVVTRWYRAPEILVSDAYGPKVDIWAVGCLLAEMVGGRPLFPGKSSAHQLWLTVRSLGSLPPQQMLLMATDSLFVDLVLPSMAERTTLAERFPQFPDDLLHLLHGCLALDPDQRLTAAEALAHPYFADVPQILEAVQASNKTPAEFWARIEEAWLSVVEASRGAVSTATFRQTTATHGQLNSIPHDIWGMLQQQQQVEVATPSSMASVHTPGAPDGRQLQRRRLEQNLLMTSSNGGFALSMLDTQQSVLSGGQSTPPASSMMGVTDPLLDSQPGADFAREMAQSTSHVVLSEEPLQPAGAGTGGPWAARGLAPGSAMHQLAALASHRSGPGAGEQAGHGAVMRSASRSRFGLAHMGAQADDTHQFAFPEGVMSDDGRLAGDMGSGGGGLRPSNASGTSACAALPAIRPKPSKSLSGITKSLGVGGAGSGAGSLHQQHSGPAHIPARSPRQTQTLPTLPAEGQFQTPAWQPAPGAGLLKVSRAGQLVVGPATSAAEGAADGQAAASSVAAATAIAYGSSRRGDGADDARSKGFLGKIRSKVLSLLQSSTPGSEESKDASAGAGCRRSGTLPAVV